MWQKSQYFIHFLDFQDKKILEADPITGSTSSVLRFANYRQLELVTEA